MSPQEVNEEETKDSPQLKEDLKGRSQSGIAHALSSIEDIVELDEEELSRRSRAASFGVEKHWKGEIRPRLNWWLYLMIVLGAAVLLVMAVVVLSFHLFNVLQSPAETEALVLAVLNALLISGATLFIDRLFTKR